jgi:hypothetical protein
MTAARVHCRCDAVEIELTSEPFVQFYCHCDDCQAVHGAAYVPESVYRAGAVKVVRRAPKAWTLKRNPRFFCGECGTRLFIDVPRLGPRGLNGYVLPQSEFRPAFHVHCRFAVRPVSDELPHFNATPARFGVDW